MTDKNGQSKGFGFVHFETKEAADDAINTVNGMLLRDKKVCVGRFTFQNRSVDADKPQKFTSVFVKNLGDQLDEDKLYELFSKYGKVTDCKVKLIQTNFISTLFFVNLD
jgi:polyadenylate-binding protein